MRERLEALALRAAESDTAQLLCCQAACDGLTERLRAAEVDPKVKVLPPSLLLSIYLPTEQSLVKAGTERAWALQAHRPCAGGEGLGWRSGCWRARKRAPTDRL